MARGLLNRPAMKTHTLASLIESKTVREVSATEKATVDALPHVRADEAHVHVGDLTLEGDLALSAGTLVVLGNLSVTEAVQTDETATLVVTGNVACRHVFLEGNLDVEGNLDARGVIYGFYEAGESCVHGRTKARVGLFGNHDWECEDEEYEVVARFSNYHQLDEGDPKVLEATLGAKAFEGLSALMGIGKSPDSNDAWGLKLLRHL